MKIFKLNLCDTSNSILLLLYQGAKVMEGVKYILRTELIFQRLPTPLTPLSASPSEWDAWHQIEHLYEESEVNIHSFVLS